MARQARELSKSGMYRVTLRGEELFKNDADKETFRKMAEKYFETGEIYGINLEKTEINLVVKEGKDGISMTMKPFTTSYARYFNKTHGAEGKLFRGRFLSMPIETESEKREQLKLIKSGTVKRSNHTVRKSGTQKILGTQKEREEKKNKSSALPSWLL